MLPLFLPSTRRVLRVLNVTALAACGILDSEDPTPIDLNVSVERPCEHFCVEGDNHELTLRAWGYDDEGVRQLEGVVFRLAASSDAIELADETVRTDAEGNARTTVHLLHAADEATVRVTLVEKPETVIAQGREAGGTVTYRILAAPPLVTFDRDSVFIVEPGCEGEASWTITAGGDVLDAGRPDFGIGDATAKLFGAVDDHTFVEGVREGRTYISLGWGGGAERFDARLPVRVGPFVPRVLTSGSGRIFLGNAGSLSASVEGACQTRAVGDQTTFTNLSPETLSLDPINRRIIGVRLGSGTYVATYGDLADTTEVAVVDFRVLPLDTVLQVGDTFDYRPQEALDASGYTAWSGRAFSYGRYLTYASSDTTVAAVTEKEAFFAEVRAKAPGTATITVRMADHHRFPVGPARTATITVVKPE